MQTEYPFDPAPPQKQPIEPDHAPAVADNGSPAVVMPAGLGVI